MFCALSSSNSLTLNRPVKPNENISAVRKSFKVQDVPANLWQILVMVDVDIGSFFEIGFFESPSASFNYVRRQRSVRWIAFPVCGE